MPEPSTAKGARGSRRSVTFAHIAAWARLGAALFTMSLPIVRLGPVLITIILPIVLLSAASCSGHPPPLLVLVAGGDCLLDRRNGSGAAGASERTDRRWDTLEVAAEGSDAFLFNLETTVGRGGSPKTKRFVFRAPAEALLPLSRFAHPVATLANNHAMDYGAEGLESTIEALEDAGIAHAGAGESVDAAWKEARIDCPGGILSVLSCGFDDDESSFSDSSGAVLAPVDTGKLAERIRQCAASSIAVVVMLHWGIEYDRMFLPSQQRIARTLVDAGADLVVGTGPHVLQGMEEYRASLICYSLGNLVFDDLGSGETSASAIVRMNVFPGRKGKLEKRFEIAPLRTKAVREGPSRLEAEEARAIVGGLALRSPDSRLFGAVRSATKDGLLWFSTGKR
jgi:poly-gamma-glutamate synthesis protein (capsule biosynthesis protein)